MKRPATRAPTQLSKSLHHQLNMYTLAATAAGVSLFAATAAEGKIIYTPTNVKISPKHKYYLQINHDGVRHFEIWDQVRWFGKFLNILPMQKGSEIWGPTPFAGLASALSSGVQIGYNNSSRFQPKNNLMATWHTVGCSTTCIFTSRGDWRNVQDRYLGLKFIVKGQAHYGWARLSISTFPITGTLTGYAYETTPNAPIIAGQTQGGAETAHETGTLGALARGVR
jgi:hypothetical protein